MNEKELLKLINKAQKEKGSFSKKIVTMVILLNVIFTIAVLYLFYKTSSEPTILIGAWFGFTTVELWSLASIKKKEIKEEEYD